MAIVELMRVRQWVKNGFVFLPMIFSGKLFNERCWLLSLIVFLSFSLLASAIYCINDIKDIESDKRHPKKCLRPLASGTVSICTALILVLALVASSYSLLFLLPAGVVYKAILIQSAYFIINIIYCFGIKNYAIVDVFTIAFGFVLRLVDGGVACGIWVSPWIVCMVFLITLFLAFAKRRDDVLINIQNTEQKSIRRSSASYTLEYLNLILGLLGAITVVCYLLYCIAPETIARFGCQYVYVTFVFVLAAILRYLMIAVVRGKSGSPTTIALTDRFIQLCMAGWILSFAFIIYH